MIRKAILEEHPASSTRIYTTPLYRQTLHCKVKMADKGFEEQESQA
jgi:hypothetical protein